ncbi:MAG: insulinase family protein, partial [Deltaproteobacteria bacterium]|nr:insulinase family protein [Deltaproteobacteria bacterium]
MGLVLGCGTLRKPPEPDRRLDVRTSGATFESDRGYRFAALPEAGATVVRLDVRYPVGSADDPPGKAGLAHLVEHLLFAVEIDRDGTRTSIGAELGRLALSDNAVTHADHTTYQVLAPASALGEVLRLEVERHTIGCAGLTPAIVAREREVVINELRERQGASGSEVQRLVHEALFPSGHPYRSVDSIESISRLELPDVCGFLVGPYRRGKVIVVASGAVDGAAL